MVKPIRLYFLIILFFFGCAEIGLNDKNGSSLPPSQPASAYPFTDIPIPPGFDRKDSKSWIYEAGSGTLKAAKLFSKSVMLFSFSITPWNNFCSKILSVI